ncbi:MAG: hypothetical protein PHV30_05785 [Candidatus Margulisbacteria bacterium]|nr:hypothetical protein [Candidatus Margulisiibacteriota bacterium]
MSLDYSFVGAVNRDNAMSAVADTMNEKNADILGITMEMGGKGIAKLNGEIFAVDKLDAAEVKNIRDNVSAADKNAILSLLGIDAQKVSGGADGATIIPTPTTDPENGVNISVQYEDKDTGKTMCIGVQLDADGKVLKFSPLKEGTIAGDGTTSDISLEKVDSNGLLESWGIDGQDLNPGDLFFVQQKLQILKDLISAVHASGKTQGDVMREVTQKFAQS